MTTIARPTSTRSHTSTTTSTVAAERRTGRTAGRIGWALTAVLVLFLLFDSVTKLIRDPFVVAACAQMGFPAATVPVIGGVLMLCIVLFVIPRTAVIGGVA